MDNWKDVICKLKDAGATNDECGWPAIDAVFALLAGHVTRDEALAALSKGGVREPEQALREVGA